MIDKVLNPFRSLPQGYYRLFVGGWLLTPVAIFTLLFFSISILGGRDINYRAMEISIDWFIASVLAYYPIAWVVVWVWQGFINEGTLQVKHENDLLSLQKEIRGKDMKHENEVQSLKRQIEQRESSITILKQKLLEETEQKHKYELLSQVLKQKIERNEQGQSPQ